MGHDLGQVREGYLADLLLVDGDPLADVSILQRQERLVAIMQNGNFHNSIATRSRAGKAARQNRRGLTPFSVRSVPPEVFESAGGQFGIADSMLNVFVSKIKLNRARVLAGVRQVLACSVAQHVRMGRKLDPGRPGGLATT